MIFVSLIFFYLCFLIFLLRTLALIKPDVVTKIGDVLEMTYASNLIVTKAKMAKLTW